MFRWILGPASTLGLFLKVRTRLARWSWNHARSDRFLVHYNSVEGSSYAFHVAVAYRRPDPDHFAFGALHAPFLIRVLAI
jgi:hypothetical protein